MTGPVSDNEPTALWSGPGGAPAHQLHAPERHTCNGCQASVCLLDLLLHACFTHIPTSEASLPFTVLLDQNVTATSQLSFSPLSQKHLECPDTPPHTYAASTTGGLSGPLLCPPIFSLLEDTRHWFSSATYDSILYSYTLSRVVFLCLYSQPFTLF